jgi:hypothetical protein
MQSILRMITSRTELKMQPTIHLQSEPGHDADKIQVLFSKCIVGCIFSFVWLIIIREIPTLYKKMLISMNEFSLVLSRSDK